MIDSKLLIGIKFKKLGEMLFSQITSILANYNYNYEPRSISVLISLSDNKQASIKEISSLLGMTHPAIVQMVNYLSRVELIRKTRSSKDKRVTLLELTEKGKEKLIQLESVIYEIQNIIENLLDDIDQNFMYSFSKLDKAVRNKILKSRIDNALKERVMRDIIIVPFIKQYKYEFGRLNNEWLNKYFEVEKEDKRLLKNPEKEIIKKGGGVFFALVNNEVVGTCAILKAHKFIYELTMMAVTKKAQGKQIGRKLALTSIGYAVDKGAKKLKLSTSVKLIAALNLFKSLGFKEVKSNTDSRYKRELIHMELDLSM